MKCYLVHAYFSGGLDRQIAFNFNIIHFFIERYVFLKKTWGFSNEESKLKKFRCFLRQHLGEKQIGSCIFEVARPRVPNSRGPFHDVLHNFHNTRTSGKLRSLLATASIVCWSLTSLCHSNGHIETMPAREINPFTARTRIRSRTQ